MPNKKTIEVKTNVDGNLKFLRFLFKIKHTGVI